MSWRPNRPLAETGRMSTLQARTMSDRVVLIHDTQDRTIISELDIDQAALLLEQLQDAVRQTLATLRLRAAGSFSVQSEATI